MTSATVSGGSPTHVRVADARLVRFGDVVRQVKESADPNTSGLTRYVAGEHMDTDDVQLRRWGAVGDGYLGPAFTRRFRPGQVLYGSRRTYLRKVAVASFEGICANTTFVCEPADGMLTPEFLPHLMRSEAFHAHSMAQSKGSVNPYVNWKDLAWFEFALPDVRTQSRIAAVLSTALRAVDKQGTVLAAAAELAHAQRTQHFTATKDLAPLGELVEMQLGKMLSKKARTGPNQLPYLANINVRWGSFELSDLKTMSFADRELGKFRLRRGDVLVCEGRGVGRSAIWQDELDECYYQKALHRLRVRDSRVTPGYLVEYLRWCSDTGRLAGLVGDSLIPHLTEVKFRELKVPVPTAHDRDQFLQGVARVAALARSTELNIRSLLALERKLSDRFMRA